VKNPNSAQLREMRRENLLQTRELSEIPFDRWPSIVVDGALRIGVFRNRTHLVQLFKEPGGMLRLSVNRTEWDERVKRFRDDISWDDLQRLKAEAGFGDRVAVEIYPPDALIVNVANMRHLWILPAGSERLPFVWNGRSRD
jgi:hypothetical protein